MGVFGVPPFAMLPLISTGDLPVWSLTLPPFGRSDGTSTCIGAGNVVSARVDLASLPVCACTLYS